MLLWCISVFEVVYPLNHHFGASFSSSLSVTLDTAISPTPRSHIATPLFVAGVLETVVGMLIRIRCFRELGQLFTFDLSTLPGHRLVTSGSYRYVRDPSYSARMSCWYGPNIEQLPYPARPAPPPSRSSCSARPGPHWYSLALLFAAFSPSRPSRVVCSFAAHPARSSHLRMGSRSCSGQDRFSPAPHDSNPLSFSHFARRIQ